MDASGFPKFFKLFILIIAEFTYSTWSGYVRISITSTKHASPSNTAVMYLIFSFYSILLYIYCSKNSYVTRSQFLVLVFFQLKLSQHPAAAASIHPFSWPSVSSFVFSSNQSTAFTPIPSSISSSAHPSSARSVVEVVPPSEQPVGKVSLGRSDCINCVGTPTQGPTTRRSIARLTLCHFAVFKPIP